MSEGLIPLTIIGGYLGSGKTTWLRHQLHHDPHPPHVIVNEAAGLPVDDLLLGGAGGLTTLAGGCCCCAGLPALVAALRSLCDQRPRPAAITLETSGLADPAAIATALRADPVLVHHIRLTAITVAVDAVNSLAQLATDPLGRAQIAAADRIIVTKPDTADPATLSRLLATLTILNPVASIEGAVAGQPCPLPPPSTPTPLPPLPDAPPPLAEKLTFSTPPDWAALSLWLSALLHARGDSIVRVKGTLQTPAGRLLIQAVRRTVQPPEILPPDATAPDFLVFIGSGFTAPRLSASLTRFAGLSA